VAGGFPVLNEPQGNVSTQGMAHFDGKWTNDNHLWWTGAKPGAKLELAVSAMKAGTYDVSVVLTKARDYGIVQLSINGKKAGDPINLYNPAVIPTDPIPLGTFDLNEGENSLTVEIIGANEKAVPAYMFGLDELILKSK